MPLLITRKLSETPSSTLAMTALKKVRIIKWSPSIFIGETKRGLDIAIVLQLMLFVQRWWGKVGLKFGVIFFQFRGDNTSKIQRVVVLHYNSYLIY